MKWLREAVTDLWNKFVDFIFRQIEGVYDLVVWVLKWIFDSLWAVIKYCLDIFFGEEGFVWYVVEMVVEFFLWMGESVLWYFPELGEILLQYEDTITWAVDLVAMLNAFFPVSESLYLLGIFMFFMFGFLVFRIIIKFAPGMGG